MAERRPPPQVWISWCDACGKPDYAYAKPPRRTPIDEVAGCPFCDTTSAFQKVSGPYTREASGKLKNPASEAPGALDEKPARLQWGHKPSIRDVPNPIHAISDEALAAELKEIGKQWDDLRSGEDDDGLGGGSPGEWMVERMDEIEAEQMRRQRKRHVGVLHDLMAIGVVGRRPGGRGRKVTR